VTKIVKGKGLLAIQPDPGGNEADAAYQAANGFARNALRALPPAAAPLDDILVGGLKNNKRQENWKC